MEQIKWIALVLVFSVLIIGCNSTYETPRVWKDMDVTKKGNKEEINISIEKDAFYRVGLGYIQDKKSKEIEYKKAKNLNGPSYRHISLFKILGDTGDGKTGSKIILKVKVTPYEKQTEDYKYRRADDKKIFTVHKASKEKPFEITMDLSKYKHIYHTTAPDETDDQMNLKNIVGVYLRKGDYKISVESLNDVSEVKKIRTYLIIEADSYGKGF